jgi:hypothetical protein
MKKLQLNKESVRVLVASDLDRVHGGRDVAFTSTTLHPRPVSSIRPTSTAVTGGHGTVSSIRPTSTAVTGGHGTVSSIRPTSTAVGGAR